MPLKQSSKLSNLRQFRKRKRLQSGIVHKQKVRRLVFEKTGGTDVSSDCHDDTPVNDSITCVVNSDDDNSCFSRDNDTEGGNNDDFSLPDNRDEQRESEESSDTDSFSCDTIGECYNCHRRLIPLFPVRRSSIHSHRPMKLFSMRCISRNAVLTFCTECTSYLTDVKVEPNDWTIIWPAFVWQFLTDVSTTSVSYIQGAPSAWQFVPVTWRSWWLPSLRSHNPTMWHVPAISHHSPLPHFKDVTHDLKRFDTMMDNLRLGEIRHVCNEINFPTILCPWGCSTFLQDVGFLPLPVVFQHVLRKHGSRVKMNATLRHELPKCYSMRQDYLDPSHPKHICADRFTVYPSLAFHPTKGMSVLTCKHHCGGTTKRYLHVPRSQLGLPPALGDQLAHCVVHHRTIKPTIPKQYNNTYQLSHQRGCFAGIDLCCLKATGNFSSRSAILHCTEALSIACRDDIRGLLGQLQEDGYIADDTASGFRKASSKAHPDGGLAFRRRYARGSTFVTTVDCMRLQKELATVHEINIQVMKNQQWHYITFKPSWIRSIVFIHPYDDYGALFLPIGNITTPKESRRRDTRLLFVLLSMITSIPSLWEHLESRLRSSTDWAGFLLAYASRKIVYYHRSTSRSKDDPYVIDRKFRAHSMLSKLAIPDAFDMPQLLRLLQGYCDNAEICFWEYVTGFVPRDPLVPIDTSDLRGSHNIFMCCRSRERIEPSGPALPLSFVADGTNFELRFLVIAADSEECTVCVRHGGQFSKWFTTTPTTTEYIYMDHNSQVITSGSWLLGVYANTKPIGTDQVRREFLRYTGGQSSAFCAEHDYPLIVVGPPDDRFRCPGLPGKPSCGAKIYYNCPKHGCRKCLCKKCLQSISDSQTLRLHRASIETATAVKVENDDDLSEHNGDEEADFDEAELDDADEDEERTFEHTISLPRASFDDTHVRGNDDDQSVNSVDNRLGLPFTHDLHDGTDEPIFDIELEDDECSSPTTELPMSISHHNTISDILPDARSNVVGNIILLNGLGSLLVRRRHNLNFSRANTEFLQRKIISRYGKSIPLAYAEATLYPSIFPYDSGWDGSILGAIPSAFLSQEKNTTSHGVASLADHATNRLFLAGNMTATDHRYQAFLFDAMVNNNCTDDDSRVVLNRGVAESNTPTGLRTRAKDDHFFSDSIDNRQMVLNLTEAQKYHPCNLFITITPNQKLMFGLAPIKEFIDGCDGIDEVERATGRQLEPWECEEYHRALHEASCTLMTRCWLKIRYIIMTYIVQSFEEPLRRVMTIFWRDEYQPTQGNLSHLHGLLQVRVDMMDTGDVRKFNDVIRGFSADIVRIDEIDDYTARGLFDSNDDWYQMVEEARTILTHKTRRNLRRTGTGDNDLERRDIDYLHITPDHTRHSTVRIDPGHKPEVIEELARCGLVNQPPPDNPWDFEGEHEVLQCFRHIPPLRDGENNMSPVNGPLFVAGRSMQNVQQTSGYTINRYVTKYLTKMDLGSHSHCKVNPKDEREVKAKTTFLHNTKISSSAFNEQKRISQQREKNHPSGRAIARTEIVQLLSREPQVYTNMIFDRVDTTPLEDRAGLHKTADKDRRHYDDDDDNDYLAQYQRMSGNNTVDFLIMSDFMRYELGFPQWRLFTPNQVVMINDNFYSQVTVSRATLFSFRPPELRELFPTMTNYFRWFKTTRVPGGCKYDEMARRLKSDIEKCEWVDGFGNNVRLQSAALGELTVYLRQVVPTLKRRPNRSIVNLFTKIIQLHANTLNQRNVRRMHRNEAWENMRCLFIYTPKHETQSPNRHAAESPLPIPVHSCVKPANATKFLFHILLSMGCFETELDLLGFPTIRESFVYAGLIDDDSDQSIRDSVTWLIRRYVIEQLRYYPVSTRTWGNYLLFAAKALRAAIIDGEIPINDMPACLYTKLREDVLDKTKARIETLRESIITAAFNELRSSLDARSNPPTLRGLIDRSETFDGVVGRTQVQTPESFDEQQKIRAMIRRTYHDYTNPSRTTLTRGLMVAGGPGNGKTHCLMYGVLYYISNGRLIIPTSVLAERSIELGGEHLHKLFHLPISSATAQRLAELAVINILRRPTSLELLLATDAIALDESGTISSTLLSALDIILRRLRGVSTYMGGVNILTTIDDKQLRPIDGYPILLSPNILTCFNVAILEHSVRSFDDPMQQRIIEITRYSDRRMQEEPQLVEEVVQIISRECTFVASFDDERITRSTLRIFGRKAPVFEAVENFYADIEQEFLRRPGANMLRTRLSEDVQIAVESHGSHQPASSQIGKLLDKDTREPRKLLFFQHAVYQFTYNDPANVFSQSRLAILVDVPSQQQVDNWETITVFAAPPGVKCAPKHITGRQQLVAEGWLEVQVGPAPEYVKTYARYGVKAQRRQYGLRPYISSTIHSIQGATLLALATSIVAHIKEMRLWEKSQWLVLISRTSYLRDVIFVGDKTQTLQMIRQVLRMRSQFNEYTEHVLLTAAGKPSTAPTIRQTIHPYRARDQSLPRDTTGFAYFLVSSETWAHTYIGETYNLHERLEQHNSGRGAMETRKHGPWCLVAYVVGFDYCETSRRHFQDDWQTVARSRTRRQIRRNHDFASPETIIETAQDLIAGNVPQYQTRAYRNKTLRLKIHADMDRDNRTTNKF